MVEPREPKGSSNPTKADAPDYIAARRERGKLAQRAFRQRQIDMIRNLENENRKLRRVITAICDAEGRKSPSLSLAIADARGVAGIPGPGLERRSNASASADSDDSGRSSTTSNDSPAYAVPTPPRSDNSRFGPVMPFFADEAADNWPQFFPATNSGAYVSPTDYEMLGNDVDTSTPSLDLTGGDMIDTVTAMTSFEPDRAIHIADPPPDIMPYLGAKAYTLAGQMYWAALAFGFQALRAIVSSSTPPPVAVEVVVRQWSLSATRLALPQVMRLMHARLAFRRYGSFQLANEQYWEEIRSFLDPNLIVRLGSALGDQLQKNGICKDDFLTPLDFEKRLREVLRDEYPVFEAALKGQALVQEHVVYMRQLMQIMTRQAVCFGDGPRWRPESINILVDGWTTSTRPFAVY